VVYYGYTAGFRKLVVRRARGDACNPLRAVADGHHPGLTADRAIFHVLLPITTARIDRNAHNFSAIRTVDLRIRIGGAVPEREIFVQIRHG